MNFTVVKKTFFLISLFFSWQVNALYFVLINPSNQQDPFWNYITDLAVDSAADLNIKFEVVYADANRMVQSDLVQHIASQPNKPDAVIFLPFGGSIIRSFNALEAAKIPFVTLERVYDRAMFPTLGYPGEKYQYWLGEYSYDNEQSAYELSEYLINKAQLVLNSNHQFYAIGLSGDFYQASINRINGLVKAVQENNQVVLNHVLPANWQREQAKQLFKQLQQKYGNNNIVFCASDHMALGVSDAASALGIPINKQLFIGGFDWLPDALLAIKQDKMTASIGGHFLQASMAVIELYDYFRGFQVFNKGLQPHRVNLSLIHADNIEQFESMLSPVKPQSINFAQFSKYWAQQNQQPHQALTPQNFASAINE